MTYNSQLIEKDNDVELNNKVVLITGGAKRVGASICRLLHSAGANVMIHYRQSKSEAEQLAAELNQQRPNSAAIICADLNQIEEVTTLASGTLKHFGQVDVLINNASSYYATKLGEIDEQAWQELMGSNLKAPLFLAQALADELRKRRGCIINIADMHVEKPKKNYIVYSLAKAGLITLTKSLARELAPQVRVNTVAPGPIMWPENNPDFDANYKQKVISETLLNTIGAPEDIAKAVKFLICDAPFITGQLIPVDGGRSLNI
ncbi:MAG: pteridine reductase [Candidatus Methylopumilus sp.]|jgi:pteridine reductase|nr:pteridine reductase [Candidatus Methylopumilus sp.]NBW60802.1 pteridine reductase [Methylophilaceae bacterium]